MSSTLKLGDDPLALDVTFNAHGWFVATVQNVDATTGAPVNWPSGTTANLVFYDSTGTVIVSWPATVSGATLSWSKQPSDWAVVPDSSAAEVLLDQGGAGKPLRWAAGTVTWR